MRGYSSEISKFINKLILYHFIGVSIPFHMPLIVSQCLDHNERYGTEKRGGVQQNFASVDRARAVVEAYDKTVCDNIAM